MTFSRRLQTLDNNCDFQIRTSTTATLKRSTLKWSSTRKSMTSPFQSTATSGRWRATSRHSSASLRPWWRSWSKASPRTRWRCESLASRRERRSWSSARHSTTIWKFLRQKTSLEHRRRRKKATRPMRKWRRASWSNIKRFWTWASLTTPWWPSKAFNSRSHPHPWPACSTRAAERSDWRSNWSQIRQVFHLQSWD